MGGKNFVGDLLDQLYHLEVHGQAFGYHIPKEGD